MILHLSKIQLCDSINNMGKAHKQSNKKKNHCPWRTKVKSVYQPRSALSALSSDNSFNIFLQTLRTANKSRVIWDKLDDFHQSFSSCLSDLN